MAYNFKNLADVELLETMPEEANVLVEVNGTTKRAPQASGGNDNSGGMKTLVIKRINNYDWTETYVASNMTFDEAKEMYMNCEPFLCYEMEISLEEDGSMNHYDIKLATGVHYYKGNEYEPERFQISTSGPIYSFYADGSVTAYID